MAKNKSNYHYHYHYQYEGPILIKDFALVKSVVRLHEGRKLKAYNPGDNNPTIGTGFNLNRKDADVVLKACGIPHKVDALKTCSETLTAAQAERLENYIIHEAAFQAVTRLGGERFTAMSPAQQAAAISLAVNSPKSMRKVSDFIKKNEWDDNYLQDKVHSAERRDKKYYPGLKNRYQEIQECLKKGDFSDSFYKKNKIDRSGNNIFDDIQLTPPQVLGRNTLLDTDQLNYLEMMRNKAYAMANAINGPLGVLLKEEALKIGTDTQSPLVHMSNMLNLGMGELKLPKSTVSLGEFQEFTRCGASLLSDTAKDYINLSHCVGFASGSLGFDDQKLAELATPFLNAAAYYQTASDSMYDLNTMFSRTGIGDTSMPLSAFHYGTGKLFQSVPHKVTLLEQQLTSANQSFDLISDLMRSDDAAQTWGKVFHGAATSTIDSVSIEDSRVITLSKTPSLSEYDFSENSAIRQPINLSLVRTINTLQSAAYFFAIVSNAAGQSELASKVTGIALPALNIASTLAMWGTITTASGPAAPYVAIAGATVMLIMGIANLFKGPEGPTPDEIILHQLERLGLHMDKRFDRLEKFIDALAKHMDVRFDALESLIKESHQFLIDAMFELKKDTQNNFTTLNQRITLLMDSFNEMLRRHEALFHDAYTQEFRRMLLFSHQLTVQQLGQQLDPNDEDARRKYLEYYRNYFSVLINDAASDTLAGASKLTPGDEARVLANILRTHYQADGSYGYETSINSIAAYIYLLVPSLEKKRYINPFIWAQGSLGLVNFVRYNPGFLYGHSVKHLQAKNIQQAELNVIQSKGQEVIQFMKDCQTKKEFWEALLSRYEAALRDVVIEIYKCHWPSNDDSQNHTEDAQTTLHHVIGLEMLATALADYIQHRAGPDAAQNRFHRKPALPASLTSEFPNPGYHIFPGLFVHMLRASKIQFHAAYHMRTIGREVLRPYLDGAAEGDSNAGCEDAVKGIHKDLEDEVNDKRSDSNPGGNFGFSFAQKVKTDIQTQQASWEQVMVDLRDVPAQMRTEAECNLATGYGKELLRRAAAKAASAAVQNKNNLPDRELMKKAFAAHANGAIAIQTTDHQLIAKLDVLDDHATLLKFFIKWLLPMHPELQVYYADALWDKDKIIKGLTKQDPLVLILHHLLEREHPRLLTHLEIFKNQLFLFVEQARWRNKNSDAIFFVDKNIVETLKLLKQFEKLYFTVDIDRPQKNKKYNDQVNESESTIQKFSVPGDGNCFFHSISKLLELHGLPNKSHTELRLEAIAYLEKDNTLQIGFGEGMELGTFENYCARMRSDGVWAEGPVIDALTKMLNVQLFIHDMGNDGAKNTFTVNEKGQYQFMLLRERNQGNEHYTPLFDRPQESLRPSSSRSEPVRKKVTTRYDNIRPKVSSWHPQGNLKKKPN